MIYLDHAATSFPKPPGVLGAIQEWFTELGVSADRGDGPRTERVARSVARCRERIGRLTGCSPDHVVFTSSGTEAINLWLRGVLRPGDRVLTTALEHNAIARPLVHLRDHHGVEFDVLPATDGRIETDAVVEALHTRDYRLLAFTHGSNVTGAVVDAAAWCAAARATGVATMVDACQTAGIEPLEPLGADAIAASAHKALHGPPGLGFLAVREPRPIAPLRFGGTGSSTALDRQPTEWPVGFESGTPNTPAILGLNAALDWLETRDARADRARQLEAIDALRDRLEADGHRCFGPRTGNRLPILSFAPKDLDPAEAGILLANAGLHVRTGHHCAPWVHAGLVTGDGGSEDGGTEERGTVRVSPGPLSAADDVLAVAATLSP